MLLAHAHLFAVPLLPRAAIDMLVDGTPSRWLAAPAQGLFGSTDAASLLGAAALGVVVLTVVGGALQYLRGRWSAHAAEDIVAGLRGRAYARLHAAPRSWHDGMETGDLVQRCTSDIDTLRAFLSVQVVQVAETVVMVALVLPMMIALSPTMALAAVVLLPPIVAFAVIFFRRVQQVFLDVEEAEGRMTSVLQENLTGIRVVRALGREAEEEARVGEHNGLHRTKLDEMFRLLATYWSVSDALCFLQVALVLFLGAHWVSVGELSFGTWVAFVTYEAMLIFPVRQLGRVLVESGKALVALRRLGAVLEAPLEEQAAPPAEGPEGSGPPAQLESVAGALRLRDVSFSYGDGPPAVDGLSLEVEAGETIALVGPPGSGKSTVLALLLRLIDPARGTLELDGLPMAALPRELVRRHVVAVLQEPFLFSRTVRENLAFGRAGADHADLEQAAEAAAVHETIVGLSKGYETMVGERGVTLSGGQRQRLALARALLLDPAVLLLDDSLSAVDTRTEARVLEVLARRRGKATTVLVAQRLSTLRAADRIVVLERGRVVQDGSHEQLIEVQGPYLRLWAVQESLEQELTSDLASSDGGAQ